MDLQDTSMQPVDPAAQSAENEGADIAVSADSARYAPGGDVSLPAVPAEFPPERAPQVPPVAEAPVVRPLLIPLFSGAVFAAWVLEILLPQQPQATVNELLGANALLYALLAAAALASLLQTGLGCKLTGCGLGFLAAFLRAWGLARAKLTALSASLSLFSVFSEPQFLLDLFLSVGPCVLMAVAALVSPMLFRGKERRRAYLRSILVSAAAFALVYVLIGSFAVSIVQPGNPLSAAVTALLLFGVLAGVSVLLLWKAASAGRIGIANAPKLYLCFCIGFNAVVLAALFLLGVCDAFCAALIAASIIGIVRLLNGRRSGLYLFAGAAICMLICAILSLLQSVDTGFAAGEARIGCAAFCALLPALALLLIRRMPAAQEDTPAAPEDAPAASSDA